MRTNIVCVSEMLLVLLLTAGAVASEPPDKLQLVSALLSFCEKRSPDAVRSAEEAYQACRDRFPDDVRVDYAYSLVLLRQQQYDESRNYWRSSSLAHGARPVSWLRGRGCGFSCNSVSIPTPCGRPRRWQSILRRRSWAEGRTM